MKDKISKIKNLFRKYGFWETIKKILKYFQNVIGPKINIFVFIKTQKNKRTYIRQLNFAIKSVKRIVIWRSSFGWNVPLYQRPQQISNYLCKKETLVLYEVSYETDGINTIKEQQENLYLVNFHNPLIKKLVMEVVEKSNKPKYIQIYSTNWSMPVSELKQYISKGYKIIYEYIDDLNATLAGTADLPVNIKEKYNYVMSDKDNVYIVVTAQEIENDVINKRGNKNLVFACNGVDYEFYNELDNNFVFDEDFEKILAQKKPIIGYYGAIASWFDYDLIKYLAEQRHDYNIVLFGIKYDDSLEKAQLHKYENIHFLGARNYSVLKNYANKFSVCTIPFLINSITESTSPVKLFEYMALGKPIVTTNMKECRKYASVMIAKSKEEYLYFIDKSINLNKEKNTKYFELLNKEALENDWSIKAQAIIDLIRKYEK